MFETSRFRFINRMRLYSLIPGWTVIEFDKATRDKSRTRYFRRHKAKYAKKADSDHESVVGLFTIPIVE